MKNPKQQTAVEWLEIELKKKGFNFPYVTLKIDQAKEMERQKIIDAHDNGYIDGSNKKKVTAEQYYNETFNK
jgi:hypothetical protein